MIRADHPFAVPSLRVRDENGNERCAACGRGRDFHLDPQPEASVRFDPGIHIGWAADDEQPGVPEGAESITEAELAEAFGNLSLANSTANPESTAAGLVAWVKGRRGPRHKPGAYEDSEGNLYVRVHGLNAWLRVMDDGTTEVRPDDGWVEHPLRKLIPEGSQEAAAVLVAEWLGLGEQDDTATPWRAGYRAALRKCADELGYALKAGDRSEH